MDSELIRKIIRDQDTETFCSLNEDDMDSCFIELLYKHFYKMGFQKLNDIQKTLFLCMVLEDHCQADGVLSLTEENEIFFLLPEIHQALLDIQAPKTAAMLQKFIDFMPTGTFKNGIIPEWDWFMDDANAPVFKDIDSVISDYPDGLMRGLYRDFILSDKERAISLLEV